MALTNRRWAGLRMWSHAHLTSILVRDFLRSLQYPHRQFIDVLDSSSNPFTTDGTDIVLVSTALFCLSRIQGLWGIWSSSAKHEIASVTETDLEELGKGLFEEPRAEIEGRVLAFHRPLAMKWPNSWLKVVRWSSNWLINVSRYPWPCLVVIFSATSKAKLAEKTMSTALLCYWNMNKPWNSSFFRNRPFEALSHVEGIHGAWHVSSKGPPFTAAGKAIAPNSSPPQKQSIILSKEGYGSHGYRWKNSTCYVVRVS